MSDPIPDFGITFDEAAEALAQMPPPSEAEMMMLAAEMRHRGLEGSGPRRWLRRARWVLFGRGERERMLRARIETRDERG